jgi:signal transduction histidine kinase
MMLDITQLKRLQERAIRTEEIRILGEISARFAHELRNPLATAGGFARRLRDAMPEGDRLREFAAIIVEEVARLEEILRILLSTIEPMTLTPTEVNLPRLLDSVIKDLQAQIEKKGIRLDKRYTSSASNIQGDEALLGRAFENILRHAVIAVPAEEKLVISLTEEKDRQVVLIRHKADGLSEEDLDQFFFPRVTSQTGLEALDLPRSKIIIHRHGGNIDVCGEEDGTISLRIELPARARVKGVP